MPADPTDRDPTVASLMADQSALVFAGLLLGGYDMHAVTDGPIGGQSRRDRHTEQDAALLEAA